MSIFNVPSSPPFGKGIPETGMAGGGPKPRTDTLNKALTFKFENISKGVTSGSQIYFISFFVNPEEFNQTEPARTSITQTKGGAFVDYFGPGLPVITIRGNTGFAPRDMGSGHKPITGQQNFLEVRALYRKYLEKVQSDPDKVKVTFYNHADNEAWEVSITNFVLLRNVSRPLLYQYTITMTCLRNVGAKISRVSSGWVGTDYTYGSVANPSERIRLAVNRLTKETGFLDSLLNKIVDITGLSSGSINMIDLINKGKEYYNTVSKAYDTVQSAISQVEDLAKTLNMYVQGATAFITKPFDLVQDAASALSDVAFEMSSVADVPHELIRSFREMACAITSIPQAAFQGFANPYVFEGESNCGASLGVPDAPVAGSPNSFTATADLPPERLVSQVFENPQLTLTLKEDPLSVTGVYLTTDVARIGNNYLDTWVGKAVNLTTVPNAPIVVDYKGYQTPSIFQKIMLHTARSHIVLDGDTLERISLEEYGDSSRWKEIVLYNSLEYPFTAGTNFQTKYKSTGFVRFYRKSDFTSVILIPKDTVVWSPAYQGTNQINFVVTQPTVLPISTSYVDVPIEAQQAGEAGDVGPGRITGFTGFVTSIQKISNISAVIGGKIWNVAKPGDVLQIPDTSAPSSDNIVSSGNTYEALFGIDILLKDGEFDSGIEGNPDLQRVYGVKNLEQALTDRLRTSLDFYVYHPEYGSNIPKYIGRKNISYWEDIVSWDIQDVCLLDPRISELQNFILNADGDAIQVEFDAIPINENTSLPLNIIL